MTYIFWQNIISIHQAPFLVELAKKNEVYLFVEKYLDRDREIQGWSIPELENVKLRLIDKSNYRALLIENLDSYHFFSGFNAYPILKLALKFALIKKCFVGIIAEPHNWLGIKGQLRRVMMFVYFLSTYRKINLILAIGSKGKWWYIKCGFPKEKIYEWGYTVERSGFNSVQQLDLNNTKQLPRLLYVGRILKDKGVFFLIQHLEVLKPHFSSLTIVGDGADLEELKRRTDMSQIKDKVIFISQCSNNDVWNFYDNSDYLILPSISKDGWGAVISEALTSGIPVIASNYCGASTLLSDNTRGFVFDAGNKDSLLNALHLALASVSTYSDSNKRTISLWAQNNIGKKAFVDYFNSIMTNVLRKNPSHYIEPPWKEKKN